MVDIANNEIDIRRAFEECDVRALQTLVQTGRYEVDTFADHWRIQHEFDMSNFIEERFCKFMTYLVASGCNVTEKNRTGQTLLHKSPYSSLVRLYSDYGADPDVVDMEGATPIFRAVEANRPDVVRELIRCDADDRAVWRTQTPLGLSRTLSHK